MTGRTMTDLGMALTMAVFTVFWSTGISLAGEARLDTAAIERLTGAKGELSEKEGVFKVSVPRGDLEVTAAGVRMTPPLGLTSWAAFQQRRKPAW